MGVGGAAKLISNAEDHPNASGARLFPNAAAANRSIFLRAWRTGAQASRKSIRWLTPALRRCGQFITGDAQRDGVGRRDAGERVVSPARARVQQRQSTTQPICRVFRILRARTSQPV